MAICLSFISGFATSTTPHSTASDPAEVQANQCLEQGTQKLEEGDIEAAKALYKRSVEIKKTPSSLFNLGVTHYHLSQPDSLCSFPHLNLAFVEEYDDAISAWKESITLQPSSPDAHTSSCVYCPYLTPFDYIDAGRSGKRLYHFPHPSSRPCPPAPTVGPDSTNRTKSAHVSAQYRVISRTRRSRDSFQSRCGAGSLYVERAPVESHFHPSDA